MRNFIIQSVLKCQDQSILVIEISDSTYHFYRICGTMVCIIVVNKRCLLLNS